MSWRIRFGRFEFDTRWWVLAAAMASVAVALGFWQLDRANQKVALESAFFDRMAMAPMPCAAAIATAEPAYLRVRLDGRYAQGTQYLLDNRTAGGVAGYEVLTPFVCRDGATLLVNRGWLAGDPSRGAIPTWTTPSEPVSLTGFVYVPTGLPPLVDDTEWAEPTERPDVYRIGYLDVERMQQQSKNARGSNAGHYRYPIVIDSSGPGVLQSNFDIGPVSPTKNWGYAVQWFAIAAAILGYLGYRSARKV